MKDSQGTTGSADTGSIQTSLQVSLGNFSLSIKTVGLHMLKLVQWTKKVWISCFEQICTFHSMVFMSTLVLIRPHFFSLPLIVGTEQIHWSLEGGFPHTDG